MTQLQALQFHLLPTGCGYVIENRVVVGAFVAGVVCETREYLGRLTLVLSVQLFGVVSLSLLLAKYWGHCKAKNPSESDQAELFHYSQTV